MKRRTFPPGASGRGASSLARGYGKAPKILILVSGEGGRGEWLPGVEANPGGMGNGAGDARYQKILEKHRPMLAQWQRAVGDSFAGKPVSGAA